jgi:hypothetical protein
MAEAQAAPAQSAHGQLTLWFGLALALITAFRIAILALSPINLHPDEAQYWAWAQSLEWGYFSKPPLIAWAIAASTAVFGDAPWAVRLFAPCAHALAALALFGLGRAMFGPIAGMWAGLGWILMPAVWLSSSVISTDALLLPLWSLALLAAWRLVETRTLRDGALLGVAIGLGGLAKYAIIYFPICMALAALISPRVRAAFLSPAAALAAAIAAAILAPNLIWNAQHDFATVTHTATNANWGGDLFNFDQLGAFLVDQVAVGGLFVAGMIIVAVAAIRGRAHFDEASRFLLCFIIPPLAVVMLQALISRAHGNWAAAAYPALVVFVAGWFATGRFLPVVNVTHAALFAVYAVLTLSPTLVDRVGLANAMKRVRNWDETATIVAARAEQLGPFTAILVDHRHSFFELTYQWRGKTPGDTPLRMWLLHDAAGNHAEASAPMAPDYGARVLVMQLSPQYETRVRDDFIAFETIERIEQDLGGGKKRAFALSIASGFAPKPRDEAFREKLKN